VLAPFLLPLKAMYEAQNSELAAQLLDVVNEAELEEFLRKLVKKTLNKVGRPLSAAAGAGLVSELRRTAERTLPALHIAVGDQGLPSAAAATQAASRTFGMELEGMSPEDRDFEIAREFVRFAQSEAARVTEAAARSRHQISNGG
jgi:hypothetical protein